MRRHAAIEKEWILQKPIENFVSDEVQLNKSQSSRLCDLFKQGCESAYIARYRGDVHGGLPPEEIRKAMEAYFDAVDLNKKVTNALTTVTAKVDSVGEKKAVAERLKQCEDVHEVGEISKEFSTGSRKTKAAVARELGLEPFAKSILDGELVDLNSLKDKQEHLKICLADLINRNEEVTKVVGKVAKLEIKSGLRIVSKVSREAAKKKEEIQTQLNKYQDYVGKNWSALSIRDHQVSALNRASEEGILTWSADLPDGEARRLHPFSKWKVHMGMIKFFQDALSYSISTYFVPKLERATKKFLLQRAMSRSIQLFGENIEQLFAQNGVHSKFVIALDPGSMIKTAFLKPTGDVIEMGQFVIRNDCFEKKGVDLLKKWTAQTGGKDVVFAIGNGSNTYNTQKAVALLIENKEFPVGIDVSFCVVPEHGASKYSCTTAALEEFGADAEIKQISAVSIGRRLIDPMSEYVKIEPQHLGQGQYQLSADEKQLKQKLSLVVRDRVSMIGADLNTASKHLLQHICGLNETTAKGILKFRSENGGFKSREELKKVKGIGAVSFQQCAGFLTVSDPNPDASSGPPAKKAKKTSSVWNPLDATIVHPEDYSKTERMLQKIGRTVADITEGCRVSTENLDGKESDILKLLQEKPNLKPPPRMMKKVRAMRDLAVGQRYSGTVRNKTDFGLFVDIGVERDGLVHISYFRNNRFGNETGEMPSVGEIIEVTVADLKNNKIALKPS